MGDSVYQTALRRPDGLKVRMNSTLAEANVTVKDVRAEKRQRLHRLAESPALHFALPNAYFDSLGDPKLAGGR